MKDEADEAAEAIGHTAPLAATGLPRGWSHSDFRFLQRVYGAKGGHDQCLLDNP